MKINSLIKTSVVLLGLSIPATSANAAILINAQQIGSHVVFDFSGSLDVTGLSTPSSQNIASNFIRPSRGAILSGTATADFYGSSAFASLPANFGTGGITNPSSVTGNLFGISNSSGGQLILPENYAGTPISGSATFNNTDFVSLGIDIDDVDQNYTWTLTNNETVELNVSTAAIPEPLTILGTIFAAGLGVAFKRKYQNV